MCGHYQKHSGDLLAYKNAFGNLTVNSLEDGCVLCIVIHICQCYGGACCPSFTVEEIPPKYCNPSTELCCIISQQTVIFTVKTPNPTACDYVL